MSEKVKVTVEQAVEFAKKGFAVECYVLPGFAAEPKPIKRWRSQPIIYPDTMLMLGLKGSEPKQGLLGAAWLKTKQDLWGKDATAQHPRLVIQKKLEQYGSTDASAIPYLTNKLGCLVRLARKEES